MKQINSALTICAIIISSIFSSCGNAGKGKINPDFIPVQTKQNGKWGMLSKDGKLLFSDKFDNEPSLAIEEAFSVQEGNNFNLYRAESKPSKINRKPLVSVGNFSDGLAPVSYPGSRITIIDKEGNDVATLMPVDGAELVKSDIAFRNGLLVVTTPDGKFGYVNQKGECVIKPTYDAALPFAYGYAMVATVTDPNNPSSSLKVSIIDTKGDIVITIEPQYTVVDLDLQNERIICSDLKGQLGFLSFKNEFKPLPPTVVNIGQARDGIFVYSTEKGLSGVMNFKDKVIIQPKYETVEIVDNNRFICHNASNWELVDGNGETTVKFGNATLVGWLEGFGYMAYDKMTCRLLGDDGKPKGNLTLFGIGLNAAACSSVRSDYQTIERIVADISSLPSAAGVLNYAWGTPAEQVVQQPDAATGIYAALPQASISGVDYLLNAVAVFSAPVGQESPITDEDGLPVQGYSFNPSALLCGVDFYFRSEAPISDKFIASVRTAFEKRGFKTVKTSDKNAKGAFFAMESDTSAVIFCLQRSGHDANFFVYPKANTTLGNRWSAILEAAAAQGNVPAAETLFGLPTTAEHESEQYVDRTPGSRVMPDSIPDESGETVSSRSLQL